jgi:hypothetical protein
MGMLSGREKSLNGFYFFSVFNLFTPAFEKITAPGLVPGHFQVMGIYQLLFCTDQSLVEMSIEQPYLKRIFSSRAEAASL